MTENTNKTEPPAVNRRLRLIRRISIIFCGLILAAVVVVIAERRLSQSAFETASSETSTKIKIGGPFTLMDHRGKQVTQADFSGKHTLIFFGYTFCPDVCPTSLSEISTALDGIGDKADQVVPLFVTVDPARDTAERLKDYVSHFHKNIVGLTGTEAQIKQAADAYRVYYAKVPSEGGKPDEYFMDHSSIIYLMGPDGQFKFHFSHQTDGDTIAAKLKTLL